MENAYNDFSIIMPILGTKKELKFAEKTIPAAINLNPHEIIFGIDSPEDQTLISILDQICFSYILMIHLVKNCEELKIIYSKCGYILR